MVSELFDVPPEGGVVLRLHVQPGAGRTAVTGRHGDALKVKVAAPPEQGRANEACVELVAKIAGVKPAEVSVVSGASSRSKKVRVAGVEAEDFARLLELALDEASGNARGGGSVPKSPSR
ncbi:MAG: uncharacterized protein QOF60_1614 [Actinomycetota bacterium]|nr:uncharacterized protein [Actinomycetota bacterium]